MRRGRVRLGVDPTAAVRILTNLIDNAIRHGAPGGQVVVRASREPGRVTLEVADDGPGIPVSDRERVVRRFERGDTADATGAGIGLGVVEDLAVRHGGGLRLEEAPGGGTRAVVELSVAPEGGGGPGAGGGPPP